MKKKLFLAAVLIAVVAVFTACSKDDDEKLNDTQPIDLSKLTGNYEAKSGDILTGTLSGIYSISVADGASVTLYNATINGTHNENYKWAGLTCNGAATIVLKGKNSIKGFCNGYPGIYVPEGKTLTIQGDGSLTASCGVSESAGGWAAGIGAGSLINCGNIEIKGGDITAIGGISSAGIGGGPAANCGNITISGGTVSASGDEYSTGIGGSQFSVCGDITIANTVTCVTATKGDFAPNSIGVGDQGTCGTVTIGGTVYWKDNNYAGTGADYLTQSPLVYQP